MFEDFIQQPTIPLDFSKAEIQEAKDSARMKLPEIIKVQIVNELSRNFDLSVEKIRERKDHKK